MMCIVRFPRIITLISGPYDSLQLFTRSSNKNMKSRADLKDMYDNYCFLVDHCDRP